MVNYGDYSVLNEDEFYQKRKVKKEKSILARVSFSTEKDPIYLDLTPISKNFDAYISKEAAQIIRELGHGDEEMKVLLYYQASEDL